MKRLLRTVEILVIVTISLVVGFLLSRYLFTSKLEKLPKVDYADFLPEKVESYEYHPPIIKIFKKEDLPTKAKSPIPNKKVTAIMEIKPKGGEANIPEFTLFQDKFGRWFVETNALGKVEVKYIKIKKRADFEFKVFVGSSFLNTDFTMINFETNLIVGISFWHIGRIHTGVVFWKVSKFKFAPTLFLALKDFRYCELSFATSYIVKDKSLMFSIGVIK